jgi:hypothetical protein
VQEASRDSEPFMPQMDLKSRISFDVFPLYYLKCIKAQFFTNYSLSSFNPLIKMNPSSPQWSILKVKDMLKPDLKVI